MRYKFSVFGFGSRNCAGISIARKVTIFAVAILVYKYGFTGPIGDRDTNFKFPKSYLIPGPTNNWEIFFWSLQLLALE